ncbi:MAG: hypothetical protein HUJ95_06585 [Bacteroidales bacterium]|nr:hypothetical protein [Bacteroidales bacterium]
MKKIVLSTIALFFLALQLSAETREMRKENPFQIGISVGDMFMETLVWHNTPHLDYSGRPFTSTFREKQNYSYTPHIGLAVDYRVNDWFEVGLHFDYQRTAWNEVYYNNFNEEISRTKARFYNLCLIPTAKFTYLHSPYISLYSSVGVGVDVNGGTEVNTKGKHVAHGAAIDIRLIAIRANYDRWFCSLGVGGLYGLKNGQTFFMLSSQILQFSIGVSL